MLTLLYDGSCSLCLAAAEEVQIAASEGIRLAPLQSETARDLLGSVPDEPVLVESSGTNRRRSWSGWGMAARLMPVLGVANSIRLMRRLTQQGVRPGIRGPVSGGKRDSIAAGLSRRSLLRIGAAAGLAPALMRLAPAGAQGVEVPSVTHETLDGADITSLLDGLEDQAALSRAREALTARGFVPNGAPAGLVFSAIGSASARHTYIRSAFLDRNGRAGFLDVRVGAWTDEDKSSNAEQIAIGVAVDDEAQLVQLYDARQSVSDALATIERSADGMVSAEVAGTRHLLTPAVGTTFQQAGPSCTACNVVTGIIGSVGCGIAGAILLNGACVGTGPGFPVCAVVANATWAAVCGALAVGGTIATCGELGYC